jgi:hypothetical protein
MSLNIEAAKHYLPDYMALYPRRHFSVTKYFSEFRFIRKKKIHFSANSAIISNHHDIKTTLQ